MLTRRRFLKGSLVSFGAAVLSQFRWVWGVARAAGRKVKVSVTTPGNVTWAGQAVSFAGAGAYSDSYSNTY